MPIYYVTQDERGINRIRKGASFHYYLGDKRITNLNQLERIRLLKIPPRYQKVWICTKKNGHIQAYGYDDQKRKQYIYHHKWVEQQEKNKFAHLLTFGQSLSKVRKTIYQHIKLKKLVKNKVIAIVVELLDKTSIRIGSPQYRSYGLLTLRKKHLKVRGKTIIFDFEGKSKQDWHLEVKDLAMANLLKKLNQKPGHRIFKYFTHKNELSTLKVTDVNDYLRHYSGQSITAKEFRTWRGSVIYLSHLIKAKHAFSEVMQKIFIEKVAKVLGNTPRVCKQSYIHPILFKMTADKLKTFIDKQHKRYSFLSKEEKVLLSILEKN